MATDLKRFSGPSVRWLGTALLMALIVTITRVYQAKGNFNSVHKQLFAVLIISLQLLLSLNFNLPTNTPTQEAFKELANALKPKLSPWAVDEQAELIENFDSLLTVLRLWRKATSKALKAAQLAVALTSLTFTVEDGLDYNGTYVTRGQVSVSDLSCYHVGYLCGKCPPPDTMQSRAYTYGQMSLAADIGTYNDISDVLESKHNYWYYHRQTRNHRQLAYRFNEYNPADKNRLYPFFTNRTFTAESLNCSKYDVLHVDDDKEPRNFTYSKTHGKDNHTIAIPGDHLGYKGTTYIYRGFHSPAAAPIYSCGDRCLKMWAYKNPSPWGLDAFYECWVSISGVANTYDPKHEIPDSMAKIAAAAIALQGPFKGPLNDANYQQSTFHAYGTAWDIHSKDIDEIGDNFARFALGSLAALAIIRPRLIELPGHVPHLGHKVHVYEPYFTVLLACIVVAHFAVFAATVFWIVRAGDSGVTSISMKPLGEHGDESRQDLVSHS
ncbi:MAG: hypothetical protein Q9188_001129 [Gyalolechia gomerana]